MVKVLCAGITFQRVRPSAAEHELEGKCPHWRAGLARSRGINPDRQLFPATRPRDVFAIMGVVLAFNPGIVGWSETDLKTIWSKRRYVKI